MLINDQLIKTLQFLQDQTELFKQAVKKMYTAAY